MNNKTISEDKRQFQRMEWNRKIFNDVKKWC